MSITSDRAALIALLGTQLTIGGQTVTVSPHAPADVQPYTLYLELAGCEPGDVFHTLAVDWEITITAKANIAVTAAAAWLDTATDTILSALRGVDGLTLGTVEPYFALISNQSGGSTAAVRLSFTSQTPID